MKQKIYDLLNNNLVFIKFLYGLIILNVVCIILESYEEIFEAHKTFFFTIEIFSVVIFSIEYLLRLWSSSESPRFEGTPFSKRIKFILSPLGIIDLLAILPFYIPFFVIVDFRILRILRLFRLLRIFKISRYSKSFKLITSVLKETRNDLSMTIFVTFILLVLSSTLMYYIESDVQPEKFDNIGESFWWAVATLTTVGYGDVYPITGVGKILSGFIALIGIGFVALPTGIISSAFIEKIKIEKDENQECTCPNCGTKFNPKNLEDK